MIKIYTDGACSGNPGRGGWAAIIINGEKIEKISGASDNTTNNRMELTAVISDITSIMLGNDEFSFGLAPSAKKKMKLFNFDNHQSKYYVRFLTKDVPGVLSKITSELAKNKLSVANLLQEPSRSGTANIMLITHFSKEINIQKVLKKLSTQKKLFKKIVMIRVRDYKKL